MVIPQGQKGAFKVCPTPNPCLLVEGQRHKWFPGVPKTKSSTILTMHHKNFSLDPVERGRVITGLPTTLDAFNAIPRQAARATAASDGRRAG
jgi:hypothetical protein